MLEDRLVVPLSEPDLADHFGVVPPRAVMLFGPPGTGKTTFAKAVASPSRLAVRRALPLPPVRGARWGGRGSADLVRADRRARACGRLHRRGRGDRLEARRRTAVADPGVTNELLKQVAEFRDREGRSAHLCDELRPGPRRRIPPAWPLRLRHPHRPARRDRPARHLVPLHPRPRHRRHRRRRTRRCQRRAHPGRHRVRGQTGLAGGLGRLARQGPGAHRRPHGRAHDGELPRRAAGDQGDRVRGDGPGVPRRRPDHRQALTAGLGQCRTEARGEPRQCALMPG